MTEIVAEPLAVETVETAGDERLNTMLAEVQRHDQAAQDIVADTRALTAYVNPVDQTMRPERGVENVLVRASSPQGSLQLRLNGVAHRQVADRLKIPWKYYERMMVGEPDLLTRNVNTWLHGEPEKRLVRLMGPLTDDERSIHATFETQFTARAFLSDRFRPLDHAALLNVLVPIAAQYGATVREWNLDEKHFHVRFVMQERQVDDIVAELRQTNPNIGAHAAVNEVVRMGAAIRNSEVGYAALSIAGLADILRCINLMIVAEKFRQAHLGGRSGEEEEFFSVETKRLDDAATFLKARDKMVEILSTETVQKTALAIAEGNDTPLDLPGNMPTFEFIGGVGKRFDLSENEVEILRDEFVSEATLTGRQTKWTLSQAATATARRVFEEGGASFERKEELETLGFKVLKDPVSRLIQKPSKN